jgi:hypothetical protein
VQLGCFGTIEIASNVWKVEEIESSSRRRVAHCQGTTMYEVFDQGG